MSLDKVHIDPDTESEVMQKCDARFNNVIEELMEDCSESVLAELDWLELARLFYTNGYINGALDTVDDEEFHEAVSLMHDEIQYQKEINKD